MLKELQVITSGKYAGKERDKSMTTFFFIIIYGKIGKRKTKTQTKSCLYNIHSYFLPSLLIESCESESCSVVSDSLGPHGLSLWSSSVQNTGVGSLSLLQGIFPTQGSNPGLPHCRQIIYQLIHKGITDTSLSGRKIQKYILTFFSDETSLRWKSKLLSRIYSKMFLAYPRDTPFLLHGPEI